LRLTAILFFSLIAIPGAAADEATLVMVLILLHQTGEGLYGSWKGGFQTRRFENTCWKIDGGYRKSLE
jgi:hypothetical protein